MDETTGWDAQKATLFICRTCRSADGESRPGEDFIHALRAGFGPDQERAQVAIRPVSCLTRCKTPVAAALCRPDGFSYVFSGLEAGDLDDLAAGARLLAGDERGLLPLRGRPPGLKRTLVARIPPFHHQEELP